MPLDPQARKLLDDMAAQGIQPNYTLSVAEAREGMILRSKLVAGDPLPVHAVADRLIPGPGGQLPVRVYLPARGGPFPALVYCHGGGWVIGDLDTHDHVCRALANEVPCAVVSVGYRLAPEHKFPAAAEDAYAATQWVIARAEELGVDPGRVAVGGDSAGGNLATVACLMARDRRGAMPVFQVLLYPVIDYNFETPSYRANAEGYLLYRADMIWFWRHYLASEADADNPYASPIRARDLSGLPPALVITAEYDPLRDEGEAYAARLAAAGVPVVLSRYDGMIHGFASRAAVLDQGRRALVQVAGALREAFAGPRGR